MNRLNALLLLLLVLALLTGCGAAAPPDGQEDSAPAVTEPTEEDPGQDVPAGTEPDQSAPAEKTPEQSIPAEPAPAEDLPAEEGDAAEDRVIDAALNYCEAATGHRPGCVMIQGEDADGLTLRLYDDMGDHIATCAWYVVDPVTLQGRDDMTGQAIDFSAYAAP